MKTACDNCFLTSKDSRELSSCETTCFWILSLRCEDELVTDNKRLSGPASRASKPTEKAPHQPFQHERAE